MGKMIFNLQRFAEVIVGKSEGDKLRAIASKTQVYGLAGNDTLESNKKNNVTLVGGTGDDVLNMTGGTGTLSGGAGKDTFNFYYSAKQTISAVIEDIDPTNDKIVVTYDGKKAEKLDSVQSGEDVIWTDKNGYFNLTLKGSSEASDYYEGNAHEYIWDILWITNRERQKEGLPPLTFSQGLTDAALLRSTEIINKYEHTRPDGTSCFTAIKKSYSGVGENIYSSPASPETAMEGWMNSPGHRANILRDYFTKLGVGYTYDGDSQWKYHWVQMFGGDLYPPDTLSTDDILKTSITSKKGSLPTSGTSKLLSGTASADYLRNGVNGASIQAQAGNDTIRNFGDSVSIDTGDDNDSIFNNGGQSLKITSNSGNNYIDNHYYNKYSNYNSETQKYATIETILPDKVTISTGAGKDTIQNYGNKTSISSGAGSDSVTNYGSSVTISGGAGDDYVWNSGTKISIKGGAGNDTIKNSNDSSEVKIYVEAGNDSIENSSSKVTISGGAGNDTIKNNYNGTNSSISGGAGNDSIESNAEKVTITGGAGNDYISNTGTSEKVTITGGTGNDTISGKLSLFKYASGDGKDVFTSYSTDTTIHLTSGSIKSSSVNGSDVILNIGKGFIKLKDSASKKITIKDSKGKVTSKTYSNKNLVLTGTEEADTLTIGNGSNITINALGGDDSITSSTSKSSISGGKGNDIINNYGSEVTITALGGDDSIANKLEKEYNFNLSKWETIGSPDKVSISGGAGKDTIDNYGASITVDAGADNDLIINGRYFEDERGGNNVTLNAGDGNDTIISHGTKSKLYASSGDDSIINGYLYYEPWNELYDPDSDDYNGNNSTISGGRGNDKIKNRGNKVSISAGVGNDFIENYGNSVSILGGDGNDTIENSGSEVSITGGAGKDILKGGKGADTLWGGKDNDSLYGGTGNNVFVYKPGEGTDKIFNYASGDMLKILKSNGKEGGTFSKSKFSSGDLTLAISGGGTVIFEGVSTSDKFNINGKTYAIKNNTLK